MKIEFVEFNDNLLEHTKHYISFDFDEKYYWAEYQEELRIQRMESARARYTNNFSRADKRK